MSACDGCTARDDEIRYLRQQLAEGQDRLLAALSPVALAQLRGRPLQGATMGVAESYTDDGGRVYVTVNGRSVPLDEYERFLSEKAQVRVGGDMVSVEEHRAAMDKLTEMMGGQ